MSFLSNIPLAGDFLSTSQADLLSNNQFLGDTSTRSGITNGSSSGGYYNLPNGLVVQYFTVSSITDNDTIDYLTAFSTSVLGIWIQGITGSTAARSLYPTPGTITLVDFQISASDTFGNGAYFLVIGY